MTYKQFIIIISLFIGINTNAQQRFNKQNFAEMYNTNGIDLHPKFQVYHNNDSTSTLFYEIDNSELKYIMAKDSTYSSKAIIHYQLYYNYKAKELVDSGSFVYNDNQNYGLNNSSYGFINIKIKKGYKYLLYIKYTDINRDYWIKKLIDIDKTNNDSRQNYYLKADDGLPFLRNYINMNERFTLLSEQNSENIINVRVFKPNISIPRPPMVEDKNRVEGLRADTLYKLSMNNGESGALEINDQGFYHFYTEGSSAGGYTVFKFTSDYPYITTAMQMIMPLRYISSGSEFKALYNAKNKKKAVNDFWIKLSGDEHRAKNMIKLFYNRVQNANINFAADREGWMTDRGMIFIIYGAPDVVYRDSGMETWQYGNYKNNKAMTFNFYKVKNPFSNSYYVMQRDESYRISWIKAIEVWRK